MYHLSTVGLLFSVLVVVSCIDPHVSKNYRTGINEQASQSTPLVETQMVVTEAVGEGAVSAAIKKDSSSMQMIEASDNETLVGVQVNFPPGSLILDTNIFIEEASTLADETLNMELGLDSEVGASAAGPAVMVSSEMEADAAEAFSLKIPLGESQLQLSDNENIVVFFKVQKAADQKVVVGVIPQEELEMGEGFVTAKVRHFGVYQAVRTLKKIETRIEEKQVEEQIVSKSVEARLPPVEFPAPKLSYNSATGTLDLVSTVTNYQPRFCLVTFDRDRTLPWDMVQMIEQASSVNARLNSLRGSNVSAMYRCRDNAGRVHFSPWSEAVLIPKLDSTSAEVMQVQVKTSDRIEMVNTSSKPVSTEEKLIAQASSETLIQSTSSVDTTISTVDRSTSTITNSTSTSRSSTMTTTSTTQSIEPTAAERLKHLFTYYCSMAPNTCTVNLENDNRELEINGNFVLQESRAINFQSIDPQATVKKLTIRGNLVIQTYALLNSPPLTEVEGETHILGRLDRYATALQKSEIRSQQRFSLGPQGIIGGTVIYSSHLECHKAEQILSKATYIMCRDPILLSPTTTQIKTL